MKVPERADKWIVFAAMLAIAAEDMYRSTGIDLQGRIVVSVLAAVILTIVYLVWRALCRLVMRILRKNQSSSGFVRIFANAVFSVAITASLLWPVLFPGHVIVEAVEIRAKAKIHTP
jgi:hypothetical protein